MAALLLCTEESRRLYDLDTLMHPKRPFSALIANVHNTVSAGC